MAHQELLFRNSAARDSRLQFELDTMQSSSSPGKLQMLFLRGGAGNPDRAIFVVGIEGLDFSCLLPAVSRSWSTSSGEAPPDAVDRLQATVFLKAVFPIGSSAAPSTVLHVSELLEAIVGRPRLPLWPSGTTLIEFLPDAAEEIQRHVTAGAQAAGFRQDLLGELVQTKLGAAIEMDVISASFAVFQMTHEAVGYAVYVEIPMAFPEEQPRITLRRGGSGLETSFQKYPWSPRWEAKEMAKRIYSFVKEQIQKSPKD